jgi:aldehyde dehydrogenase (NAD+)
MSPAILYPASFDSKAMQEEIFGPILPVLTYSTEDEMIQTLQKKSKPLALYLFTNNSQTEKEYLNS